MSRESRWPLLPNALTAVGYLAAASFGIAVGRLNGQVAVVWPASAVAFAAVALMGWRVLPGLLVGILGSSLLHGNPVLQSLAMAAPQVVEVAVAVSLARVLKLDLRLPGTGDVFRLALVAFGAAMVGAIVGMAVLVTVRHLPGSAVGAGFLRWFLGDAIGLLTYAPAMLLWAQPRQGPMRPRRVELAALTLVLALVCAFVLLRYSLSTTYRTVPTIVALMLLILWTSLRADLRVASAVVAVLSVAATIGVQQGTGALASDSALRESLNLQTFHGMVALLSLVWASAASQRNQALAESRVSELRFAAVSEATTDAQLLFAVESDGSLRLVHMNRAAMEVGARLWPGFRALQILGRGARDIVTGLVGFTTPMLERNLTFVGIAVSERRTVTYEDAIITPTMQRIAEVNVTPIIDESGTVTHVLRNSRDITARRGAEEAVRRFNEDLERRVAERTTQLAMANRELEAFSYSLSHDLRAPLRAVEGFSHALLEDLELGHVGELRDHAQRIHGAALRMKRLVDDLLRLSQVATVDLKREVIDMGQMAREIADQLQAESPQRRVDVRIADGMQVRGDARLIHVAMQNLLDNAWKYTSRTDGARIEVFQEEQPEGRVTVVRDNGVGFDPRYADRLFMPFARLHKETEYEGAGIGLATVHRVVMAHGGRVWATGAPGEGASVSMIVCGPASAEEPRDGVTA